MTSKFLIILALLVLSAFFLLMFFTTSDKNKAYIKYVLLAYPFIAIDLLPSYISTTIFDVTTMAFLLLFYRPKKTVLKYGQTYFFLIIILTIVSIIGAFKAESLTRDTASAFIEYFTTFCFAKILTEECLEDKPFYYSVVNYLKITLTVSLLFLGLQFIFGIGFTFDRSQNYNVISGLNIRYPSFFQDPQKYAQFLAVSSFLFLVKKRNSSKLPLINLLLFLLSLVAMMFTGGRAGFGGWCLGAFIVILFSNSQYRIATAISAVLLYIVVYNFSESFAMFNRISTLSEDFDFRYAIWKDAFGIFQDHPFWGIGMGNYANYVSVHNPDQYWTAFNSFAYFDHPESGYLKFLAEFGAIGFGAIIALVLIPVFNGFQFYYKNRNTNILFLIAALVSWMVGFYTVYSFGDTRVRILIITIICLLITSYKWGVQDAEE